MSPKTEYLGESERNGDSLHIFKRTTEPDALTTKTVEVGVTDAQMITTAADLLSHEKKPFQSWDELLDTAPHVDETVNKRVTDSLEEGRPALEFAGGTTGTKDFYGVESFSFSHSVSMVGAELGDKSVYVKVTTPEHVIIENVTSGMTVQDHAHQTNDENTLLRKLHLPLEQGRTYNVTFNADLLKKLPEEQEIEVIWFIENEKQFSKSLTLNPLT